MSRVYGIGETVIDIVFKDGKPLSANPGGSVLNALVSLGRLGVECSFISDIGNDQAGKLVRNFLEENQVGTSGLYEMADKPTAIALAFLDDKNDASYSFYKDYPEKRLRDVQIDFEEDDVFLFGSFFAVSESTRKPLLNLLSDANNARATVIYDPNFRKPHLKDLEKLRPWIIENIGFADIVRGSDEDFDLIFGASSAIDAHKIVYEAGCPNLIYTANKQDVAILGQGTKIWIEVPPIKPVSTIGAGDNFNAGITWTIVREELSKRDFEHLPESMWRRIGNSGIEFSAEVCKNLENYISVEFAVDILSR